MKTKENVNDSLPEGMNYFDIACLTSMSINTSSFFYTFVIVILLYEG
jgi:hypothetical protein